MSGGYPSGGSASDPAQLAELIGGTYQQGLSTEEHQLDHRRPPQHQRPGPARGRIFYQGVAIKAEGLKATSTAAQSGWSWRAVHGP